MAERAEEAVQETATYRSLTSRALDDAAWFGFESAGANRAGIPLRPYRPRNAHWPRAFWEKNLIGTAARIVDFADGMPHAADSGISASWHLAISRHGDSTSRLLSRGMFLEQARRERIRALDLKTEVSLIMLSPKVTVETARAEIHTLSKVVEGLIRATDHIGWWASNTIAILLVDADECGARTCAKRIIEKASSFSLGLRVLAQREMVMQIAERLNGHAPGLGTKVAEEGSY